VTDRLLLRFAAPFAGAEITAVRARRQAARNRLPPLPTARPFIAITPFGLYWREEIALFLSAHGISIRSRHVIADWPAASTLLYVHDDSDERLQVALAFEAAWRATGLPMRGERWDIDGVQQLAQASELKASIHERLGSIRLHLELPGVTFHTPGGDVRLRAFHVPDVGFVDLESRMLDALEALENGEENGEGMER